MPRRFSKRTAWDLAENDLARALAARRAEGKPVIDLTESNPTRCGFRYPEPLVKDVFEYEPSPRGANAAREAVARYYDERGIGVSPDALVLTASTSEGYAFLFKLLADPGDRVLVPRPSYPLLDFLADLESVELAPYRLAFDGACWSIDFDSLAAAINDRTRAVVVVNPNNPTGSFVKRAEHEALVTFCERHRLAVVCDEVFVDYAFDPHDKALAGWLGSTDVLTFTLNGVSKVLGLPQLKLGWIAVTGDAHLVAHAIARLEVIADTFLSVGSPVQAALPRLLSHRTEIQSQIMARLRSNLRGFPGLSPPLPIEGGWYGVVPCAPPDAEFAFDLLRQGILVHPGSLFGFDDEDRVVISLLAKRIE